MGFVKLEPASGKVSGTNSNMPLLVIPSAITNVGTLTTAEANSVRFYSDEAKTVELAREVVGANEIHVKVSSVTSTTDIWMDWDGVRADYAVGDTYGRNAVWSDYAIVNHLLDTTNYTGNTSFNFTNVNSVTFDGSKIGNGANFGSSNPQSGAGKHLHTGTNEVFNSTDIQSNWTLNIWLRPEVVSSFITIARYYASVTGSSKRLCQIAYDPGASRGLEFYWVGSTLNHYYSNTFFTANTTYKVTFSLGTSGALKIYVDGTSVLSTTVTNFNARGDSAGSDKRVCLGGDWFSTTLFNPYSGRMDEHRVHKRQISDDWEATEYQNQNDNGAFWVATPVGGGYRFVPQIRPFAGL
jgi:hypothetical protein